ncbi:MULTISPECIES: aspartyl-phosphate phosphatase Spo0E family protein [unclassified Candidatus Frackibacter]|uniref:aspartyl-phosphate phosphatase Spo0E family protein n=1 Tax=unclassified Candidatus Frackibacter TaxID=2648818 RepID=UPI0015A46ABC|nr:MULTISPECIES: aspartyl-phosphate phosphatase Spo0E family protein [unclassified Candidatus Frackibacter]
MINTANLDDEINKLKSELIEASQENDDLVAESVVEKSQELDKLIVAFMDKQLQG